MTRRPFRGWMAALAVALGGWGPQAALADTPPADIRLPFEMTASGHLLVTALIDGVEVKAIVDTGADGNLIDLDFLHERGIASAASNRTANGQQTENVKGGGLTIAGMALPHLIATDLGEFRQVTGASLLIGRRDLFDDRVVEIDFQTHALILHARRGFQPPPAAQLLPMTPHGIIDRHYAVPIVIGGDSVPALVDLGADLMLRLSAETAQNAGLNTQGARRIEGGGLNVRTSGYVVPSTFSLGSLEFADARVEVAGSADDPLLRKWDAILGMATLNRLHLWLDFDGRKMWFVRPPRYVLGFVTGEASGITSLTEGGGAAAAGLKVGDKITALNGLAPAEFSRTADYSRPDPVRISLEDGRQVDVTPVNIYP